MGASRHVPSALFAVLSVLWLGMSAVRSPAAQDAPGRDPYRLHEVEAQLRHEARVRVLGELLDVELGSPRAGDAGITYGSILRVNVSGRTIPDTLAWSEIQQIKVRRSSLLRGGAIGAGIIGACGLLVGLAATKDCTGEWLEPCGADAGEVAAVTLVSAGLGFACGSVIGAFFSHWETMYSVPR